MKKVYKQLFITVVALVVTAVMVTSVSYAWLVLSAAPAVNGITVTIGGGSTILLAPDISDGESHRPGVFSETLDISEFVSFTGELSPVSTADGVSWRTQVYDRYGDPAGFTEAAEGWLAFDLWLVSPGGEYDVRVSVDKTARKGSCLFELPGVSGEQLTEPGTLLAACARVGFLANTVASRNEDMLAYMTSADYDNRFWKLQGDYETEGLDADFIIYEPNASMDGFGNYVPTQPLNGSDQKTDITDRLTVQEASSLALTTLREKYAVDHKYPTFAELEQYLTAGLFYKTAADPAKGTAGAAQDEASVIVTLRKNVPQRVRVFLWLEGEDPDCKATGLIPAANLALKLELAGATP